MNPGENDGGANSGAGDADRSQNPLTADDSSYCGSTG